MNHFLWSLWDLVLLLQRPSWFCSFLMLDVDGHQACLLLGASGPGSEQEKEFLSNVTRVIEAGIKT